MVHHYSVNHDRGDEHEGRTWTLLTSHGRVLLLLAQDHDMLIREIADHAGLTERAVQGILSDLESAGYITVLKVGRRNSYRINRSRPFRHPAESNHKVGELIDLFTRH